MARKGEQGGNVRKGRGEIITLPCPQCRATLQLIGKGDACFSGKCESCDIEIEHVSKGPNMGTTEIYPVKVTEVERPKGDAPAAELPPDETDLWFNSDTPDEGPPPSKGRPRERHPRK